MMSTLSIQSGFSFELFRQAASPLTSGDRVLDVQARPYFSFTDGSFTDKESHVKNANGSRACCWAAMESLLALAVWFALAGDPRAFANQTVHFDLPATSAASLVTSDPAKTSETVGASGTIVDAEKLVTVDFHLSTILAELQAPQIEQLVVQIKPLGNSSVVVDYAPRTEFSSRYATDIAVCESNENNSHVGLGIQGSYSDMVRGNIGTDQGRKQAHESKYAQVAPQHVVAASGTTHRGRGVYFKLRADARQVIDGDRTFSVTFRVPVQWRGELIEFRVQAEAMSQPTSSAFAVITGNSPKRESLGNGRFLVAVYLDHDMQAAYAAKQLATSEQALREMATNLIKEERRTFAVPKDVYVAFRLDPRKSQESLATDKVLEVVDRVLFDKVDPYFDSQIKKLPVDTRVAILDYLEAREKFVNACEG